MRNPIIRPATNDDLPEIAAVHLRAYSKDHFTSRLPPSVLIDYYRRFLGDGTETVVSLSANGGGDPRIAGFAVFGRGVGPKIARFKRENRIAIFQTAMRNPLFSVRLALKHLWRRVGGGSPSKSTDFLLLSIAVSTPDGGIGGKLLNAFIDKARQSDAKRVGLYVNANNLRAINVYVKKGFFFQELRGGQFYMERAC